MWSSEEDEILIDFVKNNETLYNVTKTVLSGSFLQIFLHCNGDDEQLELKMHTL